MGLFEGKGASLYALWIATACAIAWQVATTVPEPYMDEIFHIPQAQAYCRGDWTRWDPKLTTPSGLYSPAALIGLLSRKDTICTPTVLRATNLLLACLLPIQVEAILRQIRRSRVEPLEAFSISLLPVVYFFSFLYYTDLASFMAVLASFQAALAGRAFVSAALGFCSLFFRQTNILWVAFSAATAFSVSLDGKKERRDISLEELSLSAVLSLPALVLSEARRRPAAFARLVLPYAAVAAAFAAFLRWNGGIVLGDKERHVAILHIPQLYYFVGFAAIFAAPVALSVEALIDSVRGRLSSGRRIVLSLLVALLMRWTIKHFTFEHPFILADNRHYAFYVWARVYRRHPFARYALIPAYMTAAQLLLQALARSRTMRLVPFLAYVVALVLSLVPSPLIEPRYYIVPFVLYRLHLRPSRGRVKLELACFAAVNAFTLWMFLRKPFKWPDEAGWQRFMW